MRIHELIGIIEDYFYLGLAGVVGLAILWTIGYFLIYRKILGGKRKPDTRKTILGFALIGYIIMVMGVTLLRRGDHFKGSVNIHFLSSYREAWNSFGFIAWQQLILNIIMFLPLGILLPLISPRFHKLKNTMTIALGFTILIETVQLITGFGVFELDDILNNILGALIGYGIIMTLLTIFKIKEVSFRKSLTYLSPLIVVSLIFGGVFTYYKTKEFGNLSLTHSYKIKMKAIDINLNQELDEVRPQVPIYKTEGYNKDTGKEFALGFFENLGIDTSELEIDQYSKTGIYWIREEPAYNIWLDYNDGTYSYSDFSSFDEGVEIITTDEETLVKELESFNIEVPSKAVFNQVEENRYGFSIERELEGENLKEGSISCTYYSDGTIKDISNNLITYNKVRDIEIKSQMEAYEDLKKGKFNYYKSGLDIRDINIKSVELDYHLDTKGYYQPVYIFDSLIDGEEYRIPIPALL